MLKHPSSFSSEKTTSPQRSFLRHLGWPARYCEDPPGPLYHPGLFQWATAIAMTCYDMLQPPKWSWTDRKVERCWKFSKMWGGESSTPSWKHFLQSKNVFLLAKKQSISHSCDSCGASGGYKEMIHPKAWHPRSPGLPKANNSKPCLEDYLEFPLMFQTFSCGCPFYFQAGESSFRLLGKGTCTRPYGLTSIGCG